MLPKPREGVGNWDIAGWVMSDERLGLEEQIDTLWALFRLRGDGGLVGYLLSWRSFHS